MTKAIRKKRGDTLLGTIEKQYKTDLGYRSDAKLSSVLKKEGASSLSKLLEMARNSDSKNKPR